MKGLQGDSGFLMYYIHPVGPNRSFLASSMPRIDLLTSLLNFMRFCFLAQIGAQISLPFTRTYALMSLESPVANAMVTRSTAPRLRSLRRTIILSRDPVMSMTMALMTLKLIRSVQFYFFFQFRVSVLIRNGRWN